MKRLPVSIITALLVCVFGFTGAALADDDLTPPTMEAITEAESQYYRTAPTFANFGFDDETALDDGWYQVDSFTGEWLIIFTDAEGTTWDDDGWALPGFAALTEGTHTVYFMASDDAGNVEGEAGEWSWQFFKDSTSPAGPTNLTSSSHFVSVWSGDQTIDVTWTDATDGGSGLDGYSIVWDTSPATAPDAIKDIEEGIEAATSPALGDGSTHFFHIRAVDNVGNWSTALHLGPFYIDTGYPSMEPLVEAEGHYYNTAPTFSVFGFDDNVALDDGWYQIDSYMGTWTSIFTNTTGDSWDNNGWALPGFTGLTQGSHTVYFKASDDIGNVEGESGEWSWQFFKDTTSPTGPTNLTSTSHTISTWTTDTTIDVTWTAATDTASGLDGYSLIWDTVTNTVPDTVKDCEESITGLTSGNLGNGSTHYLHIRAVDNAGNWGSTVHLGPFFIDITAPSTVSSLSSSSHAINTWSENTAIAITWAAATDTDSGLDGYSFIWDTSAATIPDTVKDIEESILATTSSTLSEGASHYFHIRAVDNAGTWGPTLHLGPFRIDIQNPTMETLSESEGQYYQTAPTFANLGFDDTMTIDDGWYQIDSYSGTWLSLFTNASGAAWDNDGWALPGFDGLSQGSHTVYFRVSDDYGHEEGKSGEWSWQFVKDTEAPTGPTNLASTSHSVEGWSLDNTIDVTWTAATDTGSGLDGYSILWNVNPNAIPDAVKDIEQNAQQTTSPVMPDSNSIYFHIRAVDNIGNWQTTQHYGPFYVDTVSPTMDDITEIAGQYYSTAPTFSTFGFDDNVALKYVYYRLDGYSGTWNLTATISSGTAWDSDDWVLPDFDDLDEGLHTIYFKAADHLGNVEGESGEWHWQFFKDTTPPETVTNLTTLTHTIGTWSRYKTVNMTWTDATDGISGLDGYSILWDTTPDTTPDASKDLEEGEETTTSPELENGYQHFFHIRAIDNAGNWGETVHYGPFAIDAEEPAVISDLTVLSVTRNSVTLTWTAPGDDSDNGTAYIYDIRYDKGMITEGNWSEAERATGEYLPHTANMTESYVITGLDNNSTYYIALTTMDKVYNRSDLSNVIEVTTHNAAPALSGTVTPTRGYAATDFTFRVVYQDAEDDAPVYLSVTVDGANPELLIRESGQDDDYTNGDTYYCILPGNAFELGAHTFTVTASDGYDTTELVIEDAGPYLLSHVAYDLNPFTDDNGVFLTDTSLVSQDGMLTVNFGAGTTASDANGEPLDMSILSEAALVPELPEHVYFVSPVYELGPDGAAFTPDADLSFSYDVSLLPANVTEDELVVAVWNEETGAWIPLDGSVNEDADTISVDSGHFSIYAVIAYARPASYVASNLTVTPQALTTVTELTASAHITNTGDITGDLNVTFTVNGMLIETQKLALAGDESGEISFRTVITEPGDYVVGILNAAMSRTVYTAIPTVFEVVALNLSTQEIIPGETITLTAIVTNLGDSEGRRDIDLILDGTVIETKSLTLAGGATDSVTFTFTSMENGTHTVSAGELSTEVVVSGAAVTSESLEISSSSLITTAFDISPIEATVDAEITITALVVNLNDENTEHNIGLYIDGALDQAENVTLALGETTEVVFLTSVNETGSHTARVLDMSDNFTAAASLSALPDTLLKPSFIAIIVGMLVLLGFLLFILLKVRQNGADWLKGFFSPERLLRSVKSLPDLLKRFITILRQPKRWFAPVMSLYRKIRNRVTRQKSTGGQDEVGEEQEPPIPDEDEPAETPAAAAADETNPDATTGPVSDAADTEDGLSADEYNDQGIELQANGDPVQAIMAFQKALAKDATHAEANNNIGVLFHDAGEFKKAIARYDTALKTHPDYAEAYGNRALAYKALGKKKKAIKNFSKFISMTDNEDYIKIAEAQITELKK